MPLGLVLAQLARAWRITGSERQQGQAHPLPHPPGRQARPWAGLGSQGPAATPAGGIAASAKGISNHIS